MLINKPDEWNPDLRLNFLNGLKLYIELVKRLQVNLFEKSKYI
jgi:hypothetical protein